MDRLWSPWRLPYVTGEKAGDACVFCHAPSRPTAGDLLLWRGATCFVILNLYPYNNGHVMVVPYRHAPTLAALEPGELQELAVLTQRAERVLVDAYQPQGINIGVNVGKAAGAGVVDHIHVHLVPRWTGDTSFMAVVGETRVLPEDLASTARRLRPLFERYAAG